PKKLSSFFFVQRASLSFWAFLAGCCSHPSGVLPALIASFSSLVLHCLGTDTIVASMICPPRAMQPSVSRCWPKRSNSLSISPACANASRNSQIVVASGMNFSRCPKYNPGLIYDVGMNNGDDTAYYLRRGFRVVAIEPNPALVATACERFRREIETG